VQVDNLVTTTRRPPPGRLWVVEGRQMPTNDDRCRPTSPSPGPLYAARARYAGHR
jgi:hypothetical protein